MNRNAGASFAMPDHASHQTNEILGRAIRVARGILIFGVFTVTVVHAERELAVGKFSDRVTEALATKKIDQRLAALAEAGKSLDLPEIPEAIKAAKGLSLLRERITLMDSVLARWGDLAPADAFAYAVDLPESVSKVQTLHHITVAFARCDHAGAARAVAAMRAGRSRNDAVEIVAETWAETDAEAALQWVRSLPDTGFPVERALRKIYFVWVHAAPAAAAAVVRESPSGEYKNALLVNVATGWAVSAPSAAIDWAQALPVEAERELAATSAIESWADSSPAAAAEYALRLTPSSLQQRAVRAALGRWAGQDPQEALAWAEKLSDPNLRVFGVQEIIGVCAPVLPEVTRHWVEQLSSGPARERAIDSYIAAVKPWNPEACAALALEAAEPAARQRHLDECFPLWLMWDPVRARHWVKETNLPGALRDRLLSAPARDEP
jgi:hypothetical protein